MKICEPIKIAILAMGGEGGGVLADWIVDLGEHNDFIAQTTSVPGVAQRTGATIYYVELFPAQQARSDGGKPVLAMMPLPGDVDVVLASELMEAGRAVQRGLVTPDRTTLIVSTHRIYAIAEKTAMGDGRVDDASLLVHAERSAKKFVRFDMAAAAKEAGSVVSAVLLGALAGTGVLPFGRAQFEATIERGGVGVKASLKAFAGAYDMAYSQANSSQQLPLKESPVAARNVVSSPKDLETTVLLNRVQKSYAVEAQPLILEGVRRLLDYQDPKYAALYLDRLDGVKSLVDPSSPLLQETARHLALWMSYEDTIRVADLKTRNKRFARVHSEVGVSSGQQLAIHEFMHPRIEEICETLPSGLGRWLAKPHAVHRMVARFTREGRVVVTSSLRGYFLLWGISRLRGIRRSTLRYQQENERIEQWLTQLDVTARHNPELATEVAKCQRLVKGYGDTHARGLANYQRLMAAVRQAGEKLAPATLRELRDAALADEHGKALQAALVRHALV